MQFGNERLANPDVENILVKASWPNLTQQLRRAYAASRNEHPTVR